MSKSFLSSIFIVELMGYWRLSPVPWLSFRSWRMPLQFTTRPVAALVHLLELGTLICWIVRAHRRNPQKLAHGRFYKISSPPSMASPPPAHFSPTLELTVISSGESSVSPVNESGVVWIIVSHSWMEKICIIACEIFLFLDRRTIELCIIFEQGMKN